MLALVFAALFVLAFIGWSFEAGHARWDLLFARQHPCGIHRVRGVAQDGSDGRGVSLCLRLSSRRPHSFRPGFHGHRVHRHEGSLRHHPFSDRDTIWTFSHLQSVAHAHTRSASDCFGATGTCPPAPTTRKHLTTRSSEQRLAARPFCCHRLSSPASVAELEFVKRSSSLLWFRGQVCSGSLRGQRLFLFAPWSRFAYRGRRPLRSAFPAGIARHSPGWLDAGSRSPDSEFHAPNNALQRTEAGGRLFSVYRVSSRQPLSLSLSPLGPESLAWGSSMESVFPFLLPARPSFGPVRCSVHPFPAALPLTPPPESTSSFSATSAL